MGLREDTTPDAAQVVRRVTRELHRLEALEARRRLRVRILRGLRGTIGGGATLMALLKLKLAGSLALKIGLAALVGLGLAWPVLALAILFLAGVVLAVLSLFADGEVVCPDAPCDCGCAGREARAARLAQRIAERRAWLAAPSGPAPSLLSRPAGRRETRQPLK